MTAIPRNRTSARAELPFRATLCTPYCSTPHFYPQAGSTKASSAVRDASASACRLLCYICPLHSCLDVCRNCILERQYAHCAGVGFSPVGHSPVFDAAIAAGRLGLALLDKSEYMYRLRRLELKETNAWHEPCRAHHYTQILAVLAAGEPGENWINEEYRWSYTQR